MRWGLSSDRFLVLCFSFASVDIVICGRAQSGSVSYDCFLPLLAEMRRLIATKDCRAGYVR